MKRVILFVILSMNATSGARADFPEMSKPQCTICVGIIGEVHHIDDGASVLPESVSLGTPIQGYYSFDPRASDALPDELMQGDYHHTGFGFLLNIGSGDSDAATVRTDPEVGQFTIKVINNTLSYFGSDKYQLRSRYNLTTLENIVVDKIDWLLYDPTATALAPIEGDNLPLRAPGERWRSTAGLLIRGCPPDSYDGASCLEDDQFRIRIRVTRSYLTECPNKFCRDGNACSYHCIRYWTAPFWGTHPVCTAHSLTLGACDDGDPCSIDDACNSDGECYGEPIVDAPVEICDERDNDCDGDVDEPGAIEMDETCDGIDNNCNGLADEGNPGGGSFCVTGLDGVCSTGVLECRDGKLTCESLREPSEEVCNGEDDDCDGEADEGLDYLFECGKGECRKLVPFCNTETGSESCKDPYEGAAPESCDGKDNDCDGVPDDGLPATVWCGLGECKRTIPYCEGGDETECDPFKGSSPELCDGLDNDCDGYVDEGDPEGGATCTLSGLVGPCSNGVMRCHKPDGASVPNLHCMVATPPSTEYCDGIDNDCDGLTDESDPRLGDACPTGLPGVCASGTRQCEPGGLQCVPNVNPYTLPEVCDHVDNNCDGISDETAFNLGSECSIGEGSCRVTGAIACDPTDETRTFCNVPPPATTAEICGDRIDNDCDGLPDCWDSDCPPCPPLPIHPLVDTIGDVGFDSSIAIASDGTPRIMYSAPSFGENRYISWNGFVWERETVPGSAGGVSLALTHDDLPRAAAQDGRSFIQYNAPAWERTPFESTDRWFSGALSLTNDDLPRVLRVWRNMSGLRRTTFSFHSFVRTAEYPDGIWADVESETRFYESSGTGDLALTTENRPHALVLYASSSIFLYRREGPHFWVEERVPVLDDLEIPGELRSASVAMGHDDQPQVAVSFVASTIVHSRLILASRQESGEWMVEPVSPMLESEPGRVTSAPSIAIAPSGNTAIAYYEIETREIGPDIAHLNIAIQEDISWRIVTVASWSGISSLVNCSCSLAIDRASRMHLSYYDLQNKDLMYYWGPLVP